MLYIVATPIGNLLDISIRQIETLLNSDVILAEDTRSAMTLLHNIKRIDALKIEFKKIPKVISYYKEREMEKLPEIIKMLEEGKTISLISEAGMPLISDPGYLLLKSVIQRNIAYTVVPGPSAVTTALLHSGYRTDNFMFLGFLPKKEADIVRVLKKIKEVHNLLKNTSFIFFESPSRINKTLEMINKHIPEVNVVIARELTKKYEEILQGKVSDLIQKEYKGEITLILNFN
jgi:16S rRNA (cytidine1402-2'-O)-methyltransferase